MLKTVRLYHRVAVDWVADTFGLRGEGSARARHDRARDRAHALASSAQARHERARALARKLPDRLHRPSEPRALKSWQARIAQVGAANRGRP
ncbi:MAG TPA: hypothetical protein VMC03_16325 [Streptosporangiaceae bacterium]|nr:hypothetical protein [Streptosporangiaceae bacterium]